MRWAAIRIAVDDGEAGLNNPVGGPAAQAAGDLLIEAGSAGVANDVGARDEVTAVIGYLPEDERLVPRLRQIEAALGLLPVIGIDGVASEAVVTMIQEEDWASAWKQYFKPLRIGRHIVVTPPWDTPDLLPNDKTLVIDPGMAFGTGTHPTTQLCLAALEDYLKPQENIRRVADIGTGSGILSIAAKKLGAAYVLATDTDPLAVRIAAENARVNEVTVDARATDSSWDWASEGEPFDLLVANILADVLIGLGETFASVVRPGGLYIASGIIEERETDVRFFAEGEGFLPLETRHMGDWVALVFRRAEA